VTDTISERIAETRELAAKATPGPWHSFSRGSAYFVAGSPTWPCVSDGQEGVWTIAEIDDLINEHPAEVRANAAYIANLDPAFVLDLCDRASRSADTDALVAALDEAFRKADLVTYDGTWLQGPTTQVIEIIRAALQQHEEKKL
jgi:hypothetical protein